MNPFKNMAQILAREVLIDKAFRRASKIKEERGIPDRLLRAKDVEIRKINAVSSIITAHLSSIVKSTPSLDELDEFYSELVEIIVGKAEFKRALATVNWASRRVMALEVEYREKMKRAQDARKIRYLRREFYGRVSSILKKIRNELLFLKDAREQLIKLPSLKDMKTCVIAGCPNVGKSTLLKSMTGANPRIAEYPFTTKGIMLGYLDDELQIMDTPGLLDRPVEKMNRIEKKAMAAITKKADLLIYVFDVSETCGYSISYQRNLLNSLLKAVNSKFIAVLNKTDLEHDKEKVDELRRWLMSKNTEFVKTSKKDEASTKELIKIIRRKLKDGENRTTPAK